MKKYSTLIVFLTLFIAVNAQEYYLVQFIDKSHNVYSLDNPTTFLSKESIERRKQQNIALSEDDLPVSDFYISQVKPLVHEWKYNLKWENGTVVEANAAQIFLIKNLPFVKEIKLIGTSKTARTVSTKMEHKSEKCEPDTNFYYGSSANQIQMIHADFLHDLGHKGEGVIIAMFDDGFRRADSVSFLKKVFDENRLLYFHDYVDNDNSLFDKGNHGTWTWACIASDIENKLVGTAPEASFLLYRTEDESSEKIIEEYNWAAAAEDADARGASVFSTSLGYTTFDAADAAFNHTYADMNGHTTPIAKAANKAASKGILVICSAGNEGSKPWHYIVTPSDADSAICVGAVTSDRHVSEFSSRGPASDGDVKPNTCAKGSLSATADPNDYVVNMYGTSFSCPILAGAAACLKQAFPTKNSWDLKTAIEISSHTYYSPTDSFGFGIANFETAYQILKGDKNFPFDQSNGTYIYPNPFHEKIYLRKYTQQEDESSMKLYSESGAFILEKKICFGINQYNEIDLSELGLKQAGVYYLQYIEGNKKIIYKLLKY